MSSPSLRLLSPTLFPQEQDRLWVLPVYGVEVESFERGLFLRARYRRDLVLVDGLAGRVETLEGRSLEELDRCALTPPDSWSLRVLPPSLGEEEARRRAEACCGDDGASLWGRLLRQSQAYVPPGSVRLWGRLYLLRGDEEAWDAFSGDPVPSAALLTLALGGTRRKGGEVNPGDSGPTGCG